MVHYVLPVLDRYLLLYFLEFGTWNLDHFVTCGIPYAIPYEIPRNSAEFLAVLLLKIPRNSAEFRGIPYVFQKIPYSVGSQKPTSVDTLVPEEPVCVHLFRRNPVFSFYLPAFENSRSCRTASGGQEPNHTVHTTAIKHGPPYSIFSAPPPLNSEHKYENSHRYPVVCFFLQTAWSKLGEKFVRMTKYNFKAKNYSFTHLLKKANESNQDYLVLWTH
jgi:hypothetical protein